MVQKSKYFLISFALMWFHIPLLFAGTYANIAVPFNWIDASNHSKLGPTTGGLYSSLYKFRNTGSCGTNPPNMADTLRVHNRVGFKYTKGGVGFTRLRCLSNGRLQFNNSTTCGSGSPVTQIPYPNASLNYSMRIYGNDLDPSLQTEVSGYSTLCKSRATCYVSFASLGTAPNRSFVVTWNNVPEWTTSSSASGSYNLQIILQENGEFIFQFGSAIRGPAANLAQVGWQLNTSDFAVSSMGFPADFSAVRFYIPGEGGGVTPSSFNGFDSSTAASAITGVIKTKVAGNAINLDVIALNSSGRVETQFTGDVAVELVNAASGSCSTYSVIGTTKVMAFNASDLGRKSVTFSENDARKNIRLRIKYPTFSPTIVVCSSDNFAVRPASLTGTAKDTNWTTPGTTRTLNTNTTSGTPIHKAGQPFSLTATAYNTGGMVTSGYNGSPVANLTSCVLPVSGCINGVLSSGAFSSSAGTVTSTTASYSEAGAIAATLSDVNFSAVDAADSSTIAERTVSSAAFTIGRFVPDHFDVTANTPKFNPGCSSFTYLGQPFGLSTAPVLTITAKNNSGTVTKNYAATLWNMPTNGSTITGQAWSSASGNVSVISNLPSANVTSLGSGIGTINFSVGDPATGGGLTFQHNTAIAPFNANLTLSANITDSDGVSDSSNPYLLSNIGFDDGNAATGNDSQQRYGRIGLANAHGSELIALPVSLNAQYWNGSAFVLNTNDSCTPIAGVLILNNVNHT